MLLHACNAVKNYDVDYYGNDIKDLKASSWEVCCDKCYSEKRCWAW